VLVSIRHQAQPLARAAAGNQRIVGFRAAGALLLIATVALALASTQAQALAAPPWSPPQRVSKKAYRSLSSQPVALGANGYALVAWNEGRRSAFRGARPWVALRRPGRSAFRRRTFGRKGARALAVGIAEDENVGILLTRKRRGGLLVRTHSPASGWAAPRRVTRARPFNSFDVARDGTAVIAWSSDRGVFASLRPSGGAFEAPVKLAEQPRAELVAAVGVGGAVAVAWQEGGLDDHHPVVRAKPAGASDFDLPVTPPGTVGRFATDLVVTEDEVVVLTEDYGPTLSVVASIMPSEGAFEPPLTLSRAADLNGDSKLGSDSSGRLVASWQRETRRNALPLGPDVGIRDPSGGWSAPEAVFARPGSTLVSMDVGGGGTTAIGAFRAKPRRRSLWVSLTAPGGAFRSPKRVTVIRSRRTGAEPYVAVNDAGEALVAWSNELFKPSRLFVSSASSPQVEGE